MIPNGFEALAIVKGYLAAEVAPALPDHIATEVKAAVKLLGTLGQELSALHHILPNEIAETHALCLQAATLLSAQPTSGAPADLGAMLEELNIGAPDSADLHRQLATYERLREMSADLVTRLQSRLFSKDTGDRLASELRDLLDAFFKALGQQARRRSNWQSVFPASAAPV